MLARYNAAQLKEVFMATVIPIRPIRPASPARTKITAENKCSFCKGAKCCNYVTQKIPGPRSMQDFDHLLWQIAHPNVQIYQDTDGWYIMFDTTCRYLAADGRCGIYTKRPQLCRDYSNDFCEYDEPAEKHFKLLFQNYEELERYCRKRFKRWDSRFE